MHFLRNLSVRGKFVVLLSVFALGFVAFGLISHKLTEEVQIKGPVYQEIVASKDLIADVLPPPEFIIEAHLIAQQLTHAKGSTEIDELTKQIARLKADYDSRHEFWKDYLPPGGLKRALVEDSYEPAKKYFSLIEDELIPSVRSGAKDKVSLLVDGRLESLFQEHRSAINRVVELANQFNVEKEAAATERISAGTVTVIVVTMVTLLVLIGLGALVAKQIVGPVNQISKIAREVSQGDVNVVLEFHSRDEIGQVASAFRDLIGYMKTLSAAATEIAANNLTVRIEPKSDKDALGNAFKTMITNLSNMIKELTDNATQLVSASTEIASSSEQMARGSSEQTSQTAQVSSAVEEMTATIVESSKNAGEASGMAREAASAATEGTRVVSQTIEGMNKIAQVVQESANTIQALAKSSDQIGEIIGVIDDIADQTNLLALNAAIEAARAGEQGRGFAVVADEVRKLAERTTKATKEITDMIKGIQADTKGAVVSMEQGIREVNSGKQLADRAGESLSAILDYSQRVQDMIQQIASAAEEQTAASEQIAHNVESIANVTRENASGIEQSASAAEQLNRQAEGLQIMVGKFKVTK